MKKQSYYSVLTIAGSDSGGAAGIQADLKTFSALGCYGTSAITAVTVQDTCGVYDVHSVPPEIVKQQIKVVMDDIRPSAVKIGMVHTGQLAHAIAEAIIRYEVPVIFDPVMVATSGDKLIENNTIEAMKTDLFPLCTLITPNLYEAEILAGMRIFNLDEMRSAAEAIVKSQANAVLIKGSHLGEKRMFDLYLDRNGTEHLFESEFIDTHNTHGTGCSLSSAIAALMARGTDLIQAIEEAKKYIHQAIIEGQDVQTGKGNGPLNHFFFPQQLIKHEVE